VVRFWRNALLTLHVRADLRPTRAAMAAAISLVICFLLAMTIWSADHGKTRDFLPDFYGWLLGSQFVVLGVWSAMACGQAVSRERELKTFDFLKTTRLTAGELLVGKLLGAPIVAYFVVACTLPISIVAGLLGGIRPAAVLGSLALLVVFNLFYSLVAVWGSMLVEKTSAGAVGLLGLLVNGVALGFADGPFKGFAALSVVPAVLSLHGITELGVGTVRPTVFGAEVPCFLLTVLLYVLLGAWFVLMIVRNLKRDLPQIQLLSRWQCVGLVAFWNLQFYAFLDTGDIRNSRLPFSSRMPAFDVAAMALGWNSLFLFLTGVAALSPHEKLKIWWRKWKGGEASYFSPQGLPWPWLVPAGAIAFAMLAAEAFGLRSTVPLSEWRLGLDALLFTAFLTVITRDVLFLQWCLLTRMKHAVVKGFLFLTLYYAAAIIVGVVISTFAETASRRVMMFLIVYPLLGEVERRTIAPALIVGIIGVQVVVCVLILLVIQGRLARPAKVAAVGTT